MSNEDTKLRKLLEWSKNIPGAHQHLPVLIKLRNSPLKDFIDTHLVPSIKSEDWVKDMEAHFRADNLCREIEEERESLETENEKLKVLEDTLCNLKLQEQQLELEVTETLSRLVSTETEIRTWNCAQDKLSVLRKEAILQCANLSAHQCETVRSKIQKLSLPVNRIPSCTPVPLLPSAESDRVTENLDLAKDFLSAGFHLSVRPVFRQKFLQFTSRATESLSNLDTTDSNEFRRWFCEDLELDKNVLQADVDKIKVDEKVSLIQKLVDEWTALHACLFFENYELQKTLDGEKEMLNLNVLNTLPSLEPLLKVLITEKKKEANLRHLYSILTDQSNDPEASDHGDDGRLEPTSNGDNRDDELNFTLACSLLKTWPNVKVMYQRSVENCKTFNHKWLDACEKLNLETNEAMGRFVQNQTTLITK